MTDEEYMKIAVDLAYGGMGKVNPNPMVGAVIVKDGRIIGKGYHMKYGELHAERNAFKNCTEDPSGGTIYVTLEPCCHYGKTPPCTEAIIENKISRVVIGSSDPNPKVDGGGVKVLRENGIEVTEGVLKDECDKINSIFFHYIKTGQPYVILKYAMTLDGKIATYSGKSKWITSEQSRNDVHKTRNLCKGIMVGVNTVITDNPMLTCRIEDGRNPIRIICDTNLRTPIDSNIVTTSNIAECIIATCVTDKSRHKPYTNLGCKIVVTNKKDGHVDLLELMKILGDMKIDGILLEGGGTLNWSALESGIVSHVQVYISPKIFGGSKAKSPVGGLGVELPNEAFKLKNMSFRCIGEDILVEGGVQNVYGNN